MGLGPSFFCSAASASSSFVHERLALHRVVGNRGLVVELHVLVAAVAEKALVVLGAVAADVFEEDRFALVVRVHHERRRVAKPGNRLQERGDSGILLALLVLGRHHRVKLRAKQSVSRVLNRRRRDNLIYALVSTLVTQYSKLGIGFQPLCSSTSAEMESFIHASANWLSVPRRDRKSTILPE